MAAFEVIALDTATPQLRAPGASDTYTFPRAVEMPLGTANGVLYLNGSKVMTSGSGLTFDGTTFSVLATSLSTPAFKLFYNSSSQYGQHLMDANGIYVIESPAANGVAGGSLYLKAASSLLFGASGSEAMRLTSTGLGIGTSLPVGKLDVREANRANSTNITNIGVYTTTAQAADVGGTIGLGGIFDGVSGYAPFGSIRGGKENSTIGNYAGYLAFQTIPNAGALSERMRLDSSGNLGLGVTPSAWNAAFKAMELNAGNISSISTDELSLTQNAYYGASTWQYKITRGASQYRQNNGAHQWFTAPSGTAGNAISFTQAMTLDASGNLLVGTTSSGFKLNVTTQSGADRDVFIAGISGGSNGFYVQWNHATAKTHVRIADIPTSSAGLPSGTLWNDGGTLKIT